MNEHVHPTIKEILHTALGIKEEPMLTADELAAKLAMEKRDSDTNPDVTDSCGDDEYGYPDLSEIEDCRENG